MVIPTLNEVARISALVGALVASGAEVVVADGGSSDGTPEAAAAAGARVIACERGRGRQLAAGAKAARGDILWFLHADCVPAPGAVAAIQTVLGRHPSLVGGNFRLVFDGDSDFARWLTGFYETLRRRRLYYGDSGVFLRRAAYLAIGGIPDREIMEDVAFVQALERHGQTACLTDPALVTSSRRFAGRRSRDIVAGWLVMHAGYYLGVPDGWLAAYYDSERRRHGGGQKAGGQRAA